VTHVHNRARERICRRGQTRVCEPDELSAFLDESCAGDEVLRGKVEELLAAHRQSGSFIETPRATTSILEDGETDLLIGHYRILNPISAGGMGTVYLGERADQQYEKKVAIKLIKRGMDTNSVLRRFRNEQHILASFDHSNIARLLDGGATENGLPYFVMEYVEGLPIDQYCKKHALSINERLKLFREVCAAVTYAHRRAVIHRDIKSSNILVTTEGVTKLVDFGIAKILQPGAGADSLATMTGLRVLTPEYASTEQVRGNPVSTATDIYSLGVVLHELLTRQKPYRLKTRTPEEIRAQSWSRNQHGQARRWHRLPADGRRAGSPCHNCAVISTTLC
jgi:serine/threonine protein kinase